MKKKVTRTVAQKMGIKENSRAIFVNPDKEALDGIGLPNLDISTELKNLLVRLGCAIRDSNPWPTQRQ